MKTYLPLISAAMLLSALACTKEPESGKSETVFTVTVNMPISVDNPQLTALSVTFSNTVTGSEDTATDFAAAGEGSYTVSATLEDGTYNVDLSGEITYELEGMSRTAIVNASRSNITISEASAFITIETTVTTLKSDNFVIEEIFFTGTLKPDGAQYYGDQYFKITNNSDKTLYADGLIIMQSAFMTVDKYDYTPDIMSTHFSISSGIVLPGSGSEYPVEPGESIIFADTAIDHTEYNSNSMDLSAATFEYYNDLDDEDVDNPEVPNVTTLFADDYWTIHNRGFYAYAIGRLGEGISAEQFATDYMYTAEYEMVVPDFGTFPMSDDVWKFPNEWVIDVVNLSIEETFAWTVTSPVLDSGWTYCGKIDGDETRYGKSVRRIEAGEMDGRIVYKDTNNSTVDFTPEAIPSLM